jgi:hypothetical protein
VSAVAATFAAEFEGATMARVPGTRNWMLLGWNGGGLDSSLIERRLKQAGVAERLSWIIDGDLFAPVSQEGGRHLVDGDDSVEALADAGWRQGA